MSVGKMQEFDVKTGNWSGYVERMEMYFVANDIEDKKKKLATLIAVMGESAYELLSALASPILPSKMEYDAVIALLRNHLQPTPSKWTERYVFRQRVQNVGETISDFVAGIRKLSAKCEFGINLEDNLCDQLIWGIRSDVIRQRLLSEKNLTYNNALKTAITLEAAERDSSIMDASRTRSTSEYPINQLQLRAGSQRGNRFRSGGGGAGGISAGTRHSNARNCYCTACGSTEHLAVVCKFQTYVCSKCGIVGHLRRVCTVKETGSASWNDSRGQSARRGGGGSAAGRSRPGGRSMPGGAASTRTHYVQGAESWEAGGSGQGQEDDFEEPVMQMSLSGYRPVKPNDPLFNMCKHCFIKMKLACKFKKQCRTSDKKFSHFLTMKESGEVADFEMFLKTHDDSFSFKFPLNGNSTPSFQKAKEDDNESTCTSIQNFMTDILRAEDLPDTEAQIIQEMIEKEADVLNDSLDSHWLADDASIATDFHFSPFSTPSKKNSSPPNYSPIQTPSDNQVEDKIIIDQESYIAAKKILLKTPSPIENYQNVGAKKNLDSILSEENEIAITVKIDPVKNAEVQKTTAKHFYKENDEENPMDVGYETVLPKDRIDENLEKALDDANNTEFPLHSLIAISTPSVKSELSGAGTPLIADILFGNKNNETKNHVYCTDDNDTKLINDDVSETNPLEDFFNKETGEYIGEVKKEEAEIFDDFIAPQEKPIANKTSNDFTCKLCDIKCYNKASLNKHCKLQHQVEIDSPSKKKNNEFLKPELTKYDLSDLSCQICVKKYKNTNSLKAHFIRVHQIKIETPPNNEFNDVLRPGQSKYDLSDFSCQLCVKKFINIKALKLHFRHRHNFKIETPNKSEERIECTCDRCGKSFNCKSNLNTHIRKMHKIRNDKFTCNKCSLEFSSAAKLKMHQVTHTAGTVKRYQDTVAVCNICGHQATTKSNLKAHMARRHLKEHVVECEFCEKKYYRMSDFKVHMRIHTGEKPFKCQHCTASFRRRDTLNNHMKRHTDERPHECEYCKSKFISRTLLNIHNRNSIVCIRLRANRHQENRDETQYITQETKYVPSMGTIEELLDLSPTEPGGDVDVETTEKDVELPDFKDAENLYDELSEIVPDKV